MNTLKELANQYATKQAKMVDNIIEAAPVLAMHPFEAATHGMWNVYEELESVSGAGWVELDAVLPTMDVNSDLKKVDLNVLGGQMEVTEDKAQLMGGATKYFAKKQPVLLKDAGMESEKKIIYDNYRAFAIAQGTSNTINAGGSGNTNYSIVAVRFEPGVCSGLYSPEGFKKGAALDIKWINNGALYKDTNGRLVYGVRYKGYFGVQIASARNVAAIVNINASNKPTEAEMDGILDIIRADERNTYLFCHRKCLTLLNEYKEDALQMSGTDKAMERRIVSWNGVPIVTTHNMYDGTEADVSLS